MGQAEQQVKSGARDAANHPGVRTGARVGYAAVGVVHLLLAWLALQLALLGGGPNTDQSGAFALLLTNPLGLGLTVACLVAFCLLALWQLATAALASEWKDRAKPAGLAVGYAALALVAARTLMNRSTSSTQQTAQTTGTLMSHPAGVALVGLIGAVIAGAGVWHIYAGITASFRKHLREHPPAAVDWLGRIGYPLKGIAFIAVGVLFVLAAVNHDPKQSSGLDGALRTLLGLPFGPALVTLIALGLAAYGLYCFGRAKYAKV